MNKQVTKKIVATLTSLATVLLTTGGVFMPFVAPVAEAAVLPPPFLFKFGVPGTNPGDLNNATGIDVDGSGNIYVAEQSGPRLLQKFDSAGSFLTSVNPGFGAPRGVTVSGSNVYVADNFGTSPTVKSYALSLTGPITNSFEGDRIDHIAHDSLGNIYVVAQLSLEVRKYTSSGGLIATIATGTGAGKGQLNPYPTGVAVDSQDNLYVMDRGNRRIQKFDSSGNFLLTYGWGVKTGSNVLEVCTASDASCQQGISGSGAGQFTGGSEEDLAVDASGRVYVADGERIQVFDSNGNFLTQWGSQCVIYSGNFGCVDPDGAGPLQIGDGQFSGAFGITIDTAGRILVAEFQNHRVQVFGPLVETTPIPTPAPGQCGYRTARFNGPGSAAGMTVDSSGNSYVGQTGQAVTSFDPLGVLRWNSLLPGSGSTFDVAISGGIAYAIRGNNIYKLDPATGANNGLFVTVSGARGVAADKDGDIWVISNTATVGVQAYSPAGAPVAGKGFLYAGRGIAVDSDLNVYTSKENSDFVQQWSQTGTLLHTYPVYSSDLAVDSADDLILVTYDLLGNGLFKKYDKTTYAELASWNDVDWVGQIWGIGYSGGKVYVSEYSPGTKIDVYDCPPPAPSGSPSPTGDYKDILTFNLQTLGQGAAKFDAITGSQLKVYDVDAAAFKAAYGTSFSSWKTKLDQIYNGSILPISYCTTDGDGACTALKSAPGNYLVVGQFRDTANTKTVYVSKNELSSDFNADKENFADLKVIKNFKNDVITYGPGGQVVVVDGLPVASSSGFGSYLALAAAAIAVGLGVGLYARRQAK